MDLLIFMEIYLSSVVLIIERKQIMRIIKLFSHSTEIADWILVRESNNSITKR